MTAFENTPGTFQVYATVPLATQQIQQNPTRQTATVTTPIINVTVPPPDKVKLPAPVNNVPWSTVPGPQGTIRGFTSGPITFAFPVYCQNFPIGSLPNATPFEDIIGEVFFGTREPDLTNVKITHGGIQGGSVLDMKMIGIFGWKEFAGFLNGSYKTNFALNSLQQTLKLQIPDLNGAPKMFPLGPTFKYTIMSTNGGSSPTIITFQPQ